MSSTDRAQIARFAPFDAKSSAIALPIPFEAPLMITFIFIEI
jgi:hypothetical protein